MNNRKVWGVVIVFTLIQILLVALLCSWSIWHGVFDNFEIDGLRWVFISFFFVSFVIEICIILFENSKTLREDNMLIFLDPSSLKEGELVFVTKNSLKYPLLWSVNKSKLKFFMNNTFVESEWSPVLDSMSEFRIVLTGINDNITMLHQLINSVVDNSFTISWDGGYTKYPVVDTGLTSMKRLVKDLEKQLLIANKKKKTKHHKKEMLEKARETDLTVVFEGRPAEDYIKYLGFWGLKYSEEDSMDFLKEELKFVSGFPDYPAMDKDQLLELLKEQKVVYPKQTSKVKMIKTLIGRV